MGEESISVGLDVVGCQCVDPLRVKKPRCVPGRVDNYMKDYSESFMADEWRLEPTYDYWYMGDEEEQVYQITLA
jgi:hypothetical protein